MDELSEIIARMPTWNNSDDISREPFGCLTNHNYSVKVNGRDMSSVSVARTPDGWVSAVH